MQVKEFGFAEGARFQRGADTSNPAVVGHHLELIRSRKNGQLTPEDVLDDARNPNSPLHSFFEWDDTAAAREHRLKQARQLIRTVVAIYKESPKQEPIRAYIHVRPLATTRDEDEETDRPYYTEVTEALSYPDSRRAVLLRAKRELDAWRKRYADLKDLAEVVAQVGAISSKVDALIDA